MLTFKLNDLEGRSRCNNTRLIGIPEEVEKGKPTEFVAELIKQLFTDFSDPPVIVRALRVPQPKPAEGGRPGMIFARIHYYQDKERNLRLRWGPELCFPHNGVSKLFTSPTEAKLYVDKKFKQSVVMDQN